MSENGLQRTEKLFSKYLCEKCRKEDGKPWIDSEEQKESRLFRNLLTLQEALTLDVLNRLLDCLVKTDHKFFHKVLNIKDTLWAKRFDSNSERVSSFLNQLAKWPPEKYYLVPKSLREMKLEDVAEEYLQGKTQNRYNYMKAAIENNKLVFKCQNEACKKEPCNWTSFNYCLQCECFLCLKCWDQESERTPRHDRNTSHISFENATETAYYYLTSGWTKHFLIKQLTKNLMNFVEEMIGNFILPAVDEIEKWQGSVLAQCGAEQGKGGKPLDGRNEAGVSDPEIAATIIEKFADLIDFQESMPGTDRLQQVLSSALTSATTAFEKNEFPKM